MKITYPTKLVRVAELNLNGILMQYPVPLVTGTHEQVFQALSSNKELKIAQRENLVAYVHGALIHKQNEWADQELIRFPKFNYLRIPNVLTIIPKKGDGVLEGGMLVDSDLIGEGIEKQTDIPEDLSEWICKNGLYVKDDRIFVPYDQWYSDRWNKKNGAVISLFGEEGAENLEQIAIDSKRDPILLGINPKNISTPEKRVPVLGGSSDDRLNLDCNNVGNSSRGCGVGVRRKNL